MNLICIALVFVLLLIGRESMLGEFLRIKLVDPIQFQARMWLEKDPKLSPKIKIYAFDDAAAAFLNSDDLAIDQWGKLISEMAAAKPAAIVIDKLFTFPRGDEAAVQKFVRQLKSATTRVNTAVFLRSDMITGRAMLNLDRPEFALQRLTGENSDLSQLDHVPVLAKYSYGADKSVAGSFHGNGHINYKSDHQITPFVRLSDETVIPHLSIVAGGDTIFKDGDFYVNDSRLPINDQGNTLVNFIDPQTVRRSIFSLKSSIHRANRNMGFDDVITEGQYVVLLPAMYSGHADFKSTPMGYVPGGHVIVAVLNSVLTGKWLSETNQGGLLILLATILGATIGRSLKSYLFFTGILVGAVILIGAGIFTFSYLDLVIPWLFMLFGFLLTGLTFFGLRVRQSEKWNETLKSSLGGFVSEDRLRHILKQPSNLLLKPRSRVVSIVFVDIVGFSLSCERLKAELAFTYIKDHLSNIIEIIHKHGGVIDKTLGDGLLCYFGFNLSDESSSPDHADQAIRCAMEMQAFAVENILAAEGQGRPLYPMRIGVNTSSVYIGDLGNENRVDITMIGHGVNLAARLEAACEPFRIMASASTRDLLSIFSQNSHFIHKRYMKIKHNKKLIEAYEVDPFVEDLEKLTEALQIYKKDMGIVRGENRYLIEPGQSLAVSTESGKYQVVNFSRSGFAVRGPAYVAKGVTMLATLTSDSEEFNQELEKGRLNSFNIEVRWGFRDDKDSLLGVKILALNDEQKDFILDLLRRHYSKSAA